MQYVRAFAVWLLLMGAEFVHGALRALFLAPVVGDFRARQISVFTGAIIIIAIVFLAIRWIGAKQRQSLLAFGIAWLFLTLIVEISLGRFVFGYSWHRIGEDFNMARGGLLPVGLLALTFSPIIAARFRGILRKDIH